MSFDSGGFFNSNSENSNDTRETIYNNTGYGGGNLNLANLDLQRSSSLTINSMATDHGAIERSFDFANNAFLESAGLLRSTSELSQAGLAAAAATAQPAKAMVDLLIKSIMWAGLAFIGVQGIKAYKK